MLSFTEFLKNTARKGELANTVFEERLFELVAVLHKIAAGLDMLMHGETDSARNAVHVLFSGEKVTPNQATPNPPLNPEKKLILGGEVMVIPVPDLVPMKLSSFRLKDQVHVQVMDRVGLITQAVEDSLPSDLQARLLHVRQTE